MANYSEILNEIQEQINDLQSHRDAAELSVDEKTQEIQDLQVQIASYGEQIAGLEQLKVSTQSLIDQVDDHNINLHINVTTNSDGSIPPAVVHSSSTVM